VREVFISHSSADDTFVAELRQRLTAQGVPVWVDSRKLRGGETHGRPPASGRGCSP
jgi:hypothetical protein